MHTYTSAAYSDCMLPLIKQHYLEHQQSFVWRRAFVSFYPETVYSSFLAATFPRLEFRPRIYCSVHIPQSISTMSGGFDALGLMPEILQAVSELGYLLPTDIQDEAIPLILGGGDVMAAAETGSGKTAAFCLPIVQCVHERLLSLSTTSGNTKSKPKATASIRMSASDKDSGLELDESGLSCDSTSSPDIWAGARATHGVKAGKFYYECIVSGSGICRVGWSTVAAHLELGKDKHGFGFGSTGFKSNGSFEKYGDGKFQDRDAIGCFIDFAKKEVSYSRNGVHLGKAFDLSPDMVGSVFFPAVLLKTSEMMVNFGLHPFKFPPCLPGYTALAKAAPDQIFRADANEVFIAPGVRRPLALIIEPTRDLAEQVYNALKDFTRFVNSPALEVAIATGGGDNPDPSEGRIEKRLKSGVDILVGTMGKLGALVKSKALDLSNIRFFVLDEADRLLSADSLEAVMDLFNKCPGGGAGQHRLQVCFFSATLHSPDIKRLSEQICHNPTWVDLKGTDTVPDTVHHVLVRVQPEKDCHYCAAAPHPAVTDKLHPESGGGKRAVAVTASSSRAEKSQALKCIKQHMLVKLIDQFEMSQCIVFCRTNVDCNALEEYLNAYGGAGGQTRQFRGKVESGKENKYSCCVMAGMRSMDERRASLQALKDGDVRILICTDVAARGIDIEGLPYVINMTLPDEAENYVHRIGRVGRADRMGLAFSIVAANGVGEQVWYHKCANRGKNCENRALLENGGCTMWYDEGMCLAKVEKLLNQRIPELQADLSLPEELKSLNVKYGADVKQNEQVMSVHVAQLSESVRDLAMMEMRAQNAFLDLSHRLW